MLLSRVAKRIYWAARYVERAEDTARIVRAFTDLVADTPASVSPSWEPLVHISGDPRSYDVGRDGRQGSSAMDLELAVVGHLLADAANVGSVASCIAMARENLRTTREIVPREAWESLNHLYIFTRDSSGALRRPRRARFLTRVLADCRRLDGVLAVSMSHDEAYVMWRLGRALERADMTTRVLGVRAAAVLMEQAQQHAQRQQQQQQQGEVDHDASAASHDAVQWMGVLRSVSALQAYHRATRRPIEGPAVVEFLLFNDRFPRAVRCCLREFQMALRELPDATEPLGALDRVTSALEASKPSAGDGAALDDAMDHIQLAIADLHDSISRRYLQVVDHVDT